MVALALFGGATLTLILGVVSAFLWSRHLAKQQPILRALRLAEFEDKREAVRAEQAAEEESLRAWQEYFLDCQTHIAETERMDRDDRARAEAIERQDRTFNKHMAERRRTYADFSYKAAVVDGVVDDREQWRRFQKAYPALAKVPEKKYVPLPGSFAPLPKHNRIYKMPELPPKPFPYYKEWGPIGKWKVVMGVPTPLGRPKFTLPKHPDFDPSFRPQ